METATIGVWSRTIRHIINSRYNNSSKKVRQTISTSVSFDRSFPWNCCRRPIRHRCHPYGCRNRSSRHRHYQHQVYKSVVLSNILPDVSASAACVRTASLIRGLVTGLTSSSSPSISPSSTSSSSSTTTMNENQRPSVTSSFDNNQHLHKVIYATSESFQDETDSTYPDPDICVSNHVRMVHLPINRSDSFQTFCNQHFDNKCNDSDQHSNQDSDDSDCTPIDALDRTGPDLVLFDRFYTEEAHSFRFYQRFPQTPLVLDMQDFHALRIGRHNIVKQYDAAAAAAAGYTGAVDPLGCLPSVMSYRPILESKYDPYQSKKQETRLEQQVHRTLLREIASIHRSDLTLVCSPYEMALLQDEYHIPKEKLCLASFFVQEDERRTKFRSSTKPNIDNFNIRFIFCGGFRHAPNSDAVNILLQHVWPRIQSELSTATLHVYGAFCPSSLRMRYHRPIGQTSDPSSQVSGVYIHGHVANLKDVFCGRSDGDDDRDDNGETRCGNFQTKGSPHQPSTLTIMLAPLRFGAGIKGKIVDAWTFGVPVVTTAVGSEGMFMTRKESSGVAHSFAGRVASTVDDFVQEAINLATNRKLYHRTREEGFVALETLFPADRNWSHVEHHLMQLLPHEYSGESSHLQSRRQRDYTRGILWHQATRSTEYMSRWIECKEEQVRSTTRSKL